MAPKKDPEREPREPSRIAIELDESCTEACAKVAEATGLPVRKVRDLVRARAVDILSSEMPAVAEIVREHMLACAVMELEALREDKREQMKVCNDLIERKTEEVIRLAKEIRDGQLSIGEAA